MGLRRTKVVPVQVYEPRRGYWSGNNQFGNLVSFAPDANNRQTILKLDEAGIPQMWTLSLGIYFEDAVFTALEAVAEVSFGAGGTTQQLEVDWRQGMTISLPMNAINVVARYTSTVNPPDDLKLSAIVARGSRCGCVAPTRAYRDNAAGGGGVGTAIIVPPFAGELIVIPENLNTQTQLWAATTEISFHSTKTGGGLSTGHIVGTNLDKFPKGIPIPYQTRSVKLTNNGANQMFYQFMFKLIF